MGARGRLVFCAFFVIASLWTPAYSNDACSAGCKGDSPSGGFQSGHQYKYSVEGEVDLFLSGAEKQETGTKLAAQVTVTGLGNCAQVLRVNSLQITGPDGKKYGKPVGVEKPVRFTVQDGKIGAEICAEEGDNQRSLNIKRAVISLLSTAKQNSEIDVFGVCPTDSSTSKEGGAIFVHRSRDLSRCANREKGKHDLITSIYNPKAEIKSTNILHSTLNVESKVKNGIPEKVSSTEEYLYTPFTVGQNGAKARVVTKLTLTGQGSGADNGAFKNAKSIIFENPHPVNTEHNNQANVLSALKSTAQSLQNSAGSKSAGIFAQLVKIFRSTGKEDLLSVYGQIKTGGAVKDNNLIKKVFLDALLRTGTGDSIEVSIKLLQNNELSTFEQKLVYLSLGSARHASSAAVAAAASLLDQPNIPKEVYLGVGALAGTYCREHACHASTSLSPGIAALAQKFAAKIGSCKPKTKVEEDTVVAVLKGVRNVRHIESSLVKTLVHCVTDNAVKSRVKVAALEAFHADPCTAELKKAAIDTMKNRQLDSEIRIKAFLVLVDCPCARAATEIKNLLETEPVHQVGRFITSSLRFIRASANPDRELAKQHFGQIRTPNKFNIDDRKYSHFREFSYNIDSLGLGAVAEETVIFSQDSFLPRSASLNLTTEIFGHSFNVLELGVRQGNLDRVLEHFFGPKGYFRKNKPQDIYDDISEKYEYIQSKVKEQTRTRRAVQQEIANFAKRLRGETTGFNDELDLDIVVKIFGTDAIFLSLGDDQGFNFDTILEKILKEVNTGVNQLKHFSHDFRSHVLFLDAELAYPTAIGLPLKLSLVGSATSRLNVEASVDLHKIQQNFYDTKFDFKFVPSTNVEVAGTFVVDADIVTTGLKVVANVHTSTGGHAVFKLLGRGHEGSTGNGFDLQFGLPVDKQEVLTFSHDIVLVTNEKGQQETEVVVKVPGERSEFSACFDQLSSSIGLTFCGDVSLPFKVQGPEATASLQRLAARYPLTGPSKLSFFLEKSDLKNYHILYVFGKEGNGFEFVLEAEGTKSKRKAAIALDYVNTDNEHSFKASLESPIKSASAEIGFVKNPNEVAGAVKVKNDNDEYFGRLGFKVAGNEQRKVFTPLVEFLLPKQEKKTLHVDGQIVREALSAPKTGYKYSFNGLKVNLPESNENVQVDGFVQTEQGAVSTEIKASKGDQKMSVVGSADGQNVKLEFQNTLNPAVNFKASLFTKSDKEGCQNDLNIIYGSDLNSKTNKFTLNQKFKHHVESIRNFDIVTKNQISAPALQFEVKADGEFDPKKINVDLEAKYQNRKAEFELEARTEIKKPGDYAVKFEVQFDDKGVSFFSKRDILSVDKSNFENVLQVKPGNKYELSGVVNHKVKPQDYNVGAVGHFKSSGSSEDFKFDVGATANPKVYSSHAKISNGASELVNYQFTLHPGPHPSGQLVLNLKDIVVANGQFKVANDGNGNGVIIVDFKKLGRKIKGDVHTVHKDAQYNANVDLFLDFEKDNNNKIHFNTNTVAKTGHVDSKNELNYNGQKTLFATKLDYSGTATNGKSNVFLELTLPNGRLFTFKRDGTVTQDKNEVTNGHVDYLLSDASKRGAAASSIGYKAKLANLHHKNGVYFFDYDGLVSFHLNDGKNLEYAIGLKHTPESASSTFAFKNELTGNLIPKPASLSGTVRYKPIDVVTHNFRIGGDVSVKGNYGSEFGFSFDSTENVQVDNTHQKIEADYTLKANLPIEKAHDIKLNTNYLYLIPVNTDVIIEFTTGASAQINADVYKIDSNGKLGKTSGFEKIKVIVPHHDPFTFDTSYKADIAGQKLSGAVEIKSTYGKGKSASVSVEATRVSNSEYSLQVKAHAPQAEKLKKLDISVLNKKTDANSASSHVTVDVDGKVYKVDVNAHYSRIAPLLDLTYSGPESSKPSKFYVKGSNINEHGGKVDVKIENIKDLDLESSTDIHATKDFINIKVDVNAPKLKLIKFHQDISSKDTENGKRLEFHSTNDGKNVLSGSTSYVSKQEGSKTIVEGSGTLKVKDEQKSASFKYIRDVLTEGQEQGVEEFVNLAVGDRTVVVESRVTNLEYKFSHVYCEEKKQCANVDFNSKFNIATPGVFQHTVNIGLDLRKLGFNPEFGLQMSFEAYENKPPQYLLDVHLNQDQKKYHLHAYSQPKDSDFSSGIVFTLPSRVIALESSFSFPYKTLVFPIKGEVAFFLNKNHQPNLKAGLRLLLDVNNKDKEHHGVAEIAFSHPALGKEALFRIKNALYHPADYTFKGESAATFSHPAFGEKESKATFEVGPQNAKILLRVPLTEIINLDGRASFDKDTQSASAILTLLQGKPVEFNFVSHTLQSLEFTTGYRDQGGKLSVSAHLEPGKRVEASTDLILGKDKKNIARAALFIENNLVKPDFAVSKENIQYFANAFKTDLTNLGERLKHLLEQARVNAKNDLEKAQTTFEKVAASYKTELEKLKQELLNDKSLQQINKAFYSIVHMFAEILDSILTNTAPIVKKISSQFQEAYQQIVELYEKKIIPQLNELFKTISEIGKKLFDSGVEIVSHFAALAQNFFDKHKPEFEELTGIVTEIFKDLTRILVSRIKEFRIDADNLFKEIKEKIENLPVVMMLKETLETFTVPEQVLAGLQQLSTVVKDLLPSKEGKEFADAIFDYVDKKLRQVKVNDEDEMRVIYAKLTAAIKSFVSYLRTHAGDNGLPSLLHFNLLRFNPTSPYSKLPELGAISFSPFNYLKNGDFLSVPEFIKAYAVNSFFYPPLMKGVVVNGQHIFTFDGRHLTFPGSCRYVLATDRADANFTLAIQLQNGLPQAVVLTDKSGSVIEVKENGQVALNGANHGFPVRTEDTFAFKTIDGKLGLGTFYGAMVLCTPKLTVCSFDVSGYYLGKLRGLLGDGNNEEFDDFRLPSGKIATSEAEFGNAYRLATSCPQVKTPDHHHSHGDQTEACEKVFGYSSPLATLYLFQDPKPYRQACAHATASNAAHALEEACDIGRAFLSKLRFPGFLPKECLKCHDGDAAIEIGKQTTYSGPTKQADIVVTVELTKGNEQPYKELLVPVVGHIVELLKQKKIDDIKVYLFGISPEIPWAIPIDAENAKLKGAKPKFDQDSRYNKLVNPIKTGCKTTNEYLESISNVVSQLQVELDLLNVEYAYSNLGDLEYRPGAVRTAVSLISETCTKSKLPFQGLMNAAKSKFYSELMGFQSNLFTVTPVLKIGAGKQQSQIVGFDDNSVILLGDKKRGKDTEQLRSTLEVFPDSCIDFSEKSGGTVFSVDNFKALNAAQRKQFNQQAAHAIVDKLLKYEIETKCTCLQHNAFKAKNTCVVTSKKEVARRR